MIRQQPSSTRTDTLFPYTSLFRSVERAAGGQAAPGTAVSAPPRRRTRLGRATRLGVEVLGGLVAVVVLVVAVAAWRLSEGPIRTNFLTPWLEAAVNDAGGNTISVGRSEQRRVGKECVCTCRSRWAPYHKKKKQLKKQKY